MPRLHATWLEVEAVDQMKVPRSIEKPSINGPTSNFPNHVWPSNACKKRGAEELDA